MTTDRLEVRLEEQLVGALRRDGDEQQFAYDASWLDSPGRFPISLQLPLREEPFRQEAQRWFANLLPDGAARERTARRLGVSLTNDWELLATLGRDCAGALRICPEGDVEEDAQIAVLTKDELHRIVSQGGPLALALEHGARLSLAGAQDKIPVVVTEHDEIALPKGRQASTHLLKLPNAGYPALPEVEVFTTSVAHQLEIDTVEITLRHVEDETVALVRRYDRWADQNGTVHRLHQEDGCQALGFGPNQKYENEGGPSFVDCFRLLDSHSAEITHDLPEWLRRLVVNILLGNADAHAKNMSLLRDREGYLRLAPAYDLVCTRAWSNIQTRLAQSVDGQSDAGQIGRNRWRNLSIQLGFAPGLALDEVRQLTAAFPAALDECLEHYIDAHGACERVMAAAREMRDRHRRTAQLLDD